jgi:hypothetical protein
MFQELVVDKRYPFSSALEFIAAGFFLHAESFHLVVAWLGVMAIIAMTFLSRVRFAFSEACAILSVIFLPFSNPAFEYAGISPADVFAVLSVSGLLIRFTMMPVARMKIPFEWLAFWTLMALHSAFVFLFYDLGDSALFSQRILLVTRPLISILAAAAAYSTFFAVKAKRNQVYRLLVLSFFLSSIVYLIQFFSYRNGLVPYGTMPSAGFGGIRFGGVSNEGGHLAKLTFPLLLVLLLASVSKWRWLIFSVMASVYLLNVSATGYVVFSIFISVAILIFFVQQMLRLTVRTRIIAGCLIAIASLAVMQQLQQNAISPVYAGLVNKISDALDKAEHPELDIYGRSPLIAYQMVRDYPLGTGYAGSTQRNIAMSKLYSASGENNLGINVAIACWSYFLLGIGLFLSYKFTATWYFGSQLQRAALVSLIALMAIDVLWASSGMYFAFLLTAYRPRNAADVQKCRPIKPPSPSQA